MKATGFPSLREKWVFPPNDVTMSSQVGRSYLKRCIAFLRICGCLHWFSNSIRSRVMVLHKLRVTIVAFAALEGFVWHCSANHT